MHLLVSAWPPWLVEALALRVPKVAGRDEGDDAIKDEECDENSKISPSSRVGDVQ